MKTKEQEETFNPFVTTAPEETEGSASLRRQRASTAETLQASAQPKNTSAPQKQLASRVPAGAALQIQILKDVGLPLVQAMVQVRGPAQNNQKEEALLLASLVRQAVMMGKHLARRFNLGDVTPVAREKAKLSLAGMAATHLGDIYKTTRTLPTTEECLAALSRMDQILDAQSFSSFLDDPDSGARAAYIKGIKDMLPVLTAISQFSFGQNEEELLETVLPRLEAIAGRISAQLFYSHNGEENEVGLHHDVMGAIVQLYTDCHYAEMDRLSMMSAEQREAYVSEYNYTYPMDPVWDNLDRKLKMLMVLARHVVPQP